PQCRTPGELCAGGEQARPARHAAEKQVRPDLVAPGCRFDHRASVIAGELRFGHHQRLVASAFALTPTAALTLTAGFRRSQAVVLRRAHERFHLLPEDKKASAAAATMPAPARPARLNICIRSAVGTRGSGGRP